MNISNAMAITEAEYYTDQYMGYANDMVNEYEDEPSYANNDGYKPDRSSYVNNNYDREYPSYNKNPIPMDMMINTNLKIKIVIVSASAKSTAIV
jgi:hypothetical protein